VKLIKEYNTTPQKRRRIAIRDSARQTIDDLKSIYSKRELS